MKTDLSSQVTVFVIAVEKEKNYEACLNALSKQTVKFKLDIIENYYPMSEGFNQMLTRCQTPYFIQCDEDMVLNIDSVSHMWNIISRTKSIIGTILFSLNDIHSNSEIKGIRINKTEILKQYPFQNILACENAQKIDMIKDGYIIKLDDIVMGDHSPYWTNYTIFQRYYNMMERRRLWDGKKSTNTLKELEKIPKQLWTILKQSSTELNLYALLGAFSSLFTKENYSQEKNYLTDYQNPKFQIIQRMLDAEKRN